MVKKFFCFVWLAFMPTAGLLANTALHQFGWLEKVTLVNEGITVNAKLDTGANTASLDATHISYEKDQTGKTWINFETTCEGKKLHLRYPQVGTSKIKRLISRKDKSPHPHLQRPVIEMPICLGNQKKIIEVNLQNRKRFNYSLLLGRKAITQFEGIVNPAKTYLHSACKKLNLD